MTSHYLNPVVPQNFTNNGTTGDFGLHYERELTPADRLGLIVRHSFSRFQIPNEQVQQAAGQRQYGNNAETMGIASYQHGVEANVAKRRQFRGRTHRSGDKSGPIRCRELLRNLLGELRTLHIDLVNAVG